MRSINRISDFRDGLKRVDFSGMSSKRKSLILHGVIMRLKNDGGYSFESIDKILIEFKIKRKWTMTKFLRLATDSNEEIDHYAFEKEIGLIDNNQNNSVIGSNSNFKKNIVVSSQKVKEEHVAVKMQETLKEEDNMDPGLKFYMNRPRRPTFGLKSDTTTSSEAVSFEQKENAGKSESFKIYDKIHPKRFSFGSRQGDD